jgi:hypothetical protein
MTFHDLKDIVMIYTSGKDGKPDYTWDKAKIVVWNPEEQKQMNLVFTGSSKGDKPEDYEIHFNANYEDEQQVNVFDAFDNTIRSLFPEITIEQLREYKTNFMKEILNQKTKQ